MVVQRNNTHIKRPILAKAKFSFDRSTQSVGTINNRNLRI